VNGSIDPRPPAPPGPLAGVHSAAPRTPAPLLRPYERAYSDDRPEFDEPSLGELKARHRELHLCLRCNHHAVCGMAKALDTNLLVTIATCLAFEPAGSEDADDVCELQPVEPLPST
jgi:hypothetical protein